MDDEVLAEQVLAEIKALAQAGRMEEAVSLSEKLTDNPIARSAAYYTLGVLFHVPGPHQDVDKAEMYYLEAEKGGSYSSLATYWMAKMRLTNGAFAEALDRFRRIADEDASAAYWTFVILHEHPELATSTDEARRYRDLAGRLGHIHAKRIDIIERLKLKRGFTPFARAIGDYLRLFPRAYRAVKNEEKFLYQ